MANPNASHVHADEDDVDGCVCDVEVPPGEATPDTELPVATGGVQAVAEEIADEDDIDGCDLDFTSVEPTTDEELPETVGGVA